MAKPVTPQLLVALTEQTGPEPERDTRNNATAGDVLALLKTLNGDDHLLDTVWLQDAEVHEPRVANRSLRLAPTQLGVNGVANQHLESMDSREASCSETYVPLVKRCSADVIALCLY